MCGLRPERATQHIISFISTVLDSNPKQKRLNFDTAPDLSRFGKSLGADCIPLVMYRREPQLLVEKLEKVAIKLEVRLSLYVCTDVQCMVEAALEHHFESPNLSLECSISKLKHAFDSS